MNNFDLLKSNISLFGSNIYKDSACFRVKETTIGKVIIENSLLTRILFYPYFARASHQREIEDLINHNVSQLNVLNRDNFVSTEGEVTALFDAVHKYNQAIESAKKHKFTHRTSLGRLKIGQVVNPNVPELFSKTLKTVIDIDKAAAFLGDEAELVTERRFLVKHQIKRYPGDRIDHAKEAAHIFSSTQRERLKSVVGRVIQAAASFFGKKVSYFDRFHYQNLGETESDIYAQNRGSAVSLNGAPTSYWLGHASLYLSIPIQTASGKRVPCNVITDPVEGDLNAILYPRMTRFARPVEELPAPDVYLLSHNHLDHYSKDTIKKLFATQPLMIVPKGDGERFRAIAKGMGLTGDNISEEDWWDRKKIVFEKEGETISIEITATPSRHWVGQGPCGGHESTFLGYVISGHESGDIYFAGDTARLNDDHIQKLTDHFNIRYSFQPGGPDEVRKDMESTHQASVDGLWMHAKMMFNKIYKNGMSKKLFKKEAMKLKTVFMHTMAFKLGNLHLSDTKTSVGKVLKALKNYKNMQLTIQKIRNNGLSKEAVEKEIEKQLGLKSYELQVFEELCAMASGFEFEDGEKISPNYMAQLLEKTVIVPKIGSVLDLATSKENQKELCFY